MRELHRSRYALLRSFRRDSIAVDTPIWFAFDDDGLLFRTKMGPKTRRLAARPGVGLAACDYRGRLRAAAAAVTGHATVLSGTRPNAPTACCTGATAGSGTSSR